VTGEWVQPMITCPAEEWTEDMAVSFWVGLDGYTGDTGQVEQVGTIAECLWDAHAHKYNLQDHAFWEMFPARLHMLGTVNAGASVDASVTSTGGGRYELSVSYGTAKPFAETKKCAKTCLNLSAEWVTEKDVSHDLPSFSSWNLTGGDATTSANSQQQNIQSFSNNPPFTLSSVTMESPDQDLTYNTCAVSGGSFTVQLAQCS
jgi:hypothetical protein